MFFLKNMYLVFSFNYILVRFILSYCNRHHNPYDIHKLAGYINTYIFAFYVVSSIILMYFYNDDYQFIDNYVDLLDMFRDYFIYDIVNMTVFSSFRKNIPFYIHHSIFLISYFYYYDYLFDFRLHLTKILFCEITQFFLINCWFLHKFTNYRTLLKFNGLLLLITFFLFRVVNFTYHTILSFYILPNSMYYTSYLMFTLTGLNIYWFKLLLEMFHRV